MYPECNFIENFEKSQLNLLTMLKEKIKDPSSKKQLDEMLKTSHPTESKYFNISKDIYTSILFNYLMILIICSSFL